MALLRVNFYSDVLNGHAEMNVILPDDPESRRSSCWKTLYLLHGMGDNHTVWSRYTSIERYASEKGVAVVMPTVHLGWYTDMFRGPRYWTYLRTLPQICRQMFPHLSPRREDTFAAGLSMGGYGALKCALRAPEVFSQAATLSGALDIVSLLHSPFAADPEKGRYWENLFGDRDSVQGSFNDLMAAAAELSPADRPRIYQWCGTEDFLYPDNLRMRDHLNALGYDLTYEEGSGDHQWKYWDAQIQRVLDWLPLYQAQ